MTIDAQRDALLARLRAAGLGGVSPADIAFAAGLIREQQIRIGELEDIKRGAAKLVWQFAEAEARATAAEQERDEAQRAVENLSIGASKAVRRAEKAEAERGRLRVALEPFAAFASGHSFGSLPDTLPMTMGSAFARVQITAGDFKRARAALTTEDRAAGATEGGRDAV